MFIFKALIFGKKINKKNPKNEITISAYFPKI